MHSVTEAAVKMYMKSIMRMIGAANRTQAAIWALRNVYFSEHINSETRERAKDIQEVPSANGQNC
jgi:hypothetical protein